MAGESAPDTFRSRQKVVASVDLPGVPAGTRGRVMMRTGFSWVRYRVRFDNGEEVPWLDERHLVAASDYQPPADDAGERSAAPA
ncbi:MAG: hypothetical protein R2716_06090 [Microthrixaceae bacterium]